MGYLGDEHSGYFLLLPNLPTSPRLAGLSCRFTGKVPGGGSCWWAALSQGGGDPAFSFLKLASPSGLGGKYYLSVLASHLLTPESPGDL